MWLGLPSCEVESTFRASLVVGHQILETVLPGYKCSSFMNFALESINIAISGLGGVASVVAWLLWVVGVGTTGSHV